MVITITARSSAVGWKDLCDAVFPDALPAQSGRGIVLSKREQRGQVAGQGDAFIQDKCDAVVSMSRGGEDLAVDAQAGQEGPAFAEAQQDVSLPPDRRISDTLASEQFFHWCYQSWLAFHQDQLSARVLDVLSDPRMIGVKMRNDQEADLLRAHSLALEHRVQLRECPGPAAIDQQFTAFDVDRIVIGGLVADIDGVHFSSKVLEDLY